MMDDQRNARCDMRSSGLHALALNQGKQRKGPKTQSRAQAFGP